LIPDVVIGFFFNLYNPSSHTTAMGLTQTLTEMINLYGWPAHKADNLTIICEPTVWKSVSLNISQPNGPPLPVTGRGLPFLQFLVFAEAASCFIYFYTAH
jgi:hypothetical protein